MASWTPIGWAAIYITASIVIPRNRVGRGYVTRLLGKIIPPRVLWIPPAGATYRYFLLLVINLSLYLTGMISLTVQVLTFWPIVIGLYIDDYINGGDDWKKRWESVKNKIKWKMELPKPATRSVTCQILRGLESCMGLRSSPGWERSR